MLLFNKPPIGSGWLLKGHTFLSGTGSGGLLTSPPIDTTGADLLLFCYTPQASAATINDSNGNTYTLAIGASQVFIYYNQGGVVGAGHTFYTTLSPNVSLAVLAFSGSIASPLDQTNSTAAPSPGAITPQLANELVVTCCYTNPPAVPSIGSGYTIGDAYGGAGGVSYGIGTAWLFQTTAMSTNPTWTNGAAASIASFKRHP